MDVGGSTLLSVCTSREMQKCSAAPFLFRTAPASACRSRLMHATTMRQYFNSEMPPGCVMYDLCISHLTNLNVHPPAVQVPNGSECCMDGNRLATGSLHHGASGSAPQLAINRFFVLHRRRVLPELGEYGLSYDIITIWPCPHRL